MASYSVSLRPPNARSALGSSRAWQQQRELNSRRWRCKATAIRKDLNSSPAAERPADDRRRTPMSAWTSDELDTIGEAEELDIASLRRDGTHRKPVTIWVVRHGDDIYVRSVNGRTSSWFRGAQARHEAHIDAGGVDKDVLLVETDDLNDKI